MNTYSMAVAKKIICSIWLRQILKSDAGVRSEDLTQLDRIPSPFRGGSGWGKFRKAIFLTVTLIHCLALSVWAENKNNTTKSEPFPIQNITPKEQASPAAYEIDWTSINGGGSIALASTNYSMRVSTSQSVIGESQSANYKMGIGFWYGTGLFCTAKSGDANGDNKLTLPDIITLVNHVFKGGPKPNPACRGDANNDNKITLPDIITMVNHIFKGGPKPGKDLDGVCCL